MGESWLGVLVSFSSPPSRTSHVQPEPNWPTPLASNCDLNSSNEPNAELMASARSPEGSPPSVPPARIDSQKSVWLACPPPLLRNGPCLSSGRDDRLARTSSTGLPSHSVPESASLALSTYA